MLYEPIEIEVSAKHLEKVFRKIKGHVCLIGGWATYHIVGKNFEDINGRKYTGSEDERNDSYQRVRAVLRSLQV